MRDAAVERLCWRGVCELWPSFWHVHPLLVRAPQRVHVLADLALAEGATALVAAGTHVAPGRLGGAAEAMGAGGAAHGAARA